MIKKIAVRIKSSKQKQWTEAASDKIMQNNITSPEIGQIEKSTISTQSS